MRQLQYPELMKMFWKQPSLGEKARRIASIVGHSIAPHLLLKKKEKKKEVVYNKSLTGSFIGRILIYLFFLVVSSSSSSSFYSHKFE